MQQRNSMRSYTWTALILLLTLSCGSWGQNKNYETFDWRPVKIQRPSSILPYQSDGATTSSYDSRYFDNSAPYHGSTGYYPDSPGSYSGPYSADSYSADYQKSQPYQYPDDSGSYEQYGYTRDDNFNITVERYGGFGGTGDTRGYGAYDFPKRVHDEVPQDLHHELNVGGTAFPDLLRLGRERIYHRRNPMQVHPLPPPL